MIRELLVSVQSLFKVEIVVQGLKGLMFKTVQSLVGLKYFSESTFRAHWSGWRIFPSRRSKLFGRVDV